MTLITRETSDRDEQAIMLNNGETMTRPRQQIVVAVSTERGYATFMVIPQGTHNRDRDEMKFEMEGRVSAHAGENPGAKIKYVYGESLPDVLDNAKKSGVTIPPSIIDELKLSLAGQELK